MYQAVITDREAGQRFDKYLHRILPNAGSGFLYKMLRKKNITLNDKKADGSEKLAESDCVRIYFAQETLDKFMGVGPSAGQGAKAGEASAETGSALPMAKTDGRMYRMACQMLRDIRILYENEHILIADKPAGVLSQKAANTDVSLNEWLIGCLLEKKELSEEDLTFYKPSVCNRLDRNTSGIVLCAKTLKGAQLLGELLKNRTLHKYYQLYVKGHIGEERLIQGYLVKDEKRNKVRITPAPETAAHVSASGAADREQRDAAGSYIKTRYQPLKTETDKTLLEVELITGKPHQIRAHLASIGHPLLGDYKYGDRAWNETYRQKYGVQSQLLHAYKVVFPKLEPPFADLSGRTFLCEPPPLFGRVAD